MIPESPSDSPQQTGWLPVGQAESLPLSWQRVPASGALWHHRRLWPLGTRWLALADIPEAWSAVQVARALETQGHRLVVRGCNRYWAQLLADWGFAAVPVGLEAVLTADGEHFKRPSIRALTRRGLRHGTVREVQAGTWLPELYAASRYARRPTLWGLFRPMDDTRLRWFVLVASPTSQKPHVLAAVSISRQSPTRWHVERMVRRAKAPVGVMEAVLEQAFALLCAEGATELSLGEAPFVRPLANQHTAEPAKQRFLAQSIRWVGRRIRYAYNAEGLYRFKAKFRPQWRTVYVCGRPRPSFLLLAGLFVYSGVARLAIRRLWPW